MSDFLAGFEQIDLSHLWLYPYLSIHHAFKHAPKLPLHDWLNDYFNTQNIRPTNHQNHPLSFTHQNDLVHGTPYETHISTHHKIPTRDNLHDWFNGCVWSIFPKTKALLNAKHLAHISDTTTANKRNRIRDTITVFDENGAIVVVSDETLGGEIAQALVHFDWQTCLVKHRIHWHNPNNSNHTKAQVFIFGHALLEQLINPYKSLCSHAVIVNVPPTFFGLNDKQKIDFIDDFLCYKMDKFLQDGITPKSLHPLPILGVPHFWDNGDPAFYDDPFVFRSGRKHGA